jgi:hypothetical protein
MSGFISYVAMELKLDCQDFASTDLRRLVRIMPIRFRQTDRHPLTYSVTGSRRRHGVIGGTWPRTE